MTLLLLLLACNGSPQTATTAPGPAPGQGPPMHGPPPAMAALMMPEDLSGSWRGDLAAAVPPPQSPAKCPDGMLPVPRGPFLMGSASAHAGKDEQPVHRVVTDAFCMDRTEVSAGDVAAWMKSAGRTPVGADPRNPDSAGRALPGLESHPAEGLTWAESSAYCAARSARLPTEAEWEKAARGGCELGHDKAACDPGDLRAYPWGSAGPTCALANHQQVGEGGPRLCHEGSLPVDSLPAGAGPYGHLHLAGNAWEYVSDAWHPGVYRNGRGSNPVGPPAQAGAPRTLRGGGWNTFSTNMRVANRFHDLVMGSAAGFRCVSSQGKSFTVDQVQPIQMVKLTGTVTREDGAAMAGRALYVTAFDAAETDPATGMPAPGRSPAAEVRVSLDGGSAQHFELPVPLGGTYRISAALDDGSGASDMPAAGSGGVGFLAQPVQASGDQGGLSVVLGPPPGRRHHP